MHIVFSNYDDINNPYYGGGGAIAIHQLATRLQPRHAITIYTGSYPHAKNEIIDNIIYKRIGFPWMGPKLGQLFFQLSLPILAMTQTFDIWVESFTPPFSAAFLPLFTKKPVIATTHFLSAIHKAKQYKLPFHWIEQLGLKHYQHLVALTPKIEAQILTSNPTAQIKVIPNGTLIKRSKVVVSPKNYFLYLGRLDLNQKGLDLLIQSFAQVHHQLSDTLVIAGSGSAPNKSKLKKLIHKHKLQDKVTVLGHIDGNRKIKLIRYAKALLMPSRYEGQPLTCIEAIVLGTPIICFNISDISWLTNQICLKATALSPRSFAHQLQKISTSKQLREKLSQNCLAQADQYDWDSIAYKYDQLITKVSQAS